jgi:putative ABC transport system substrate-binding protein
MNRREFITLLGGAAAAWPLTARGQRGEQIRRIGVLLPAAADDPEWQARVGAFQQALALLGWTIGRNVRIDTRWGTTSAAEIRRQAAELAALAPDVILAGGASGVGPLLQATRTVPIVFTLGVDPVGAGVVDSLARPGGNATGFMAWEFSIAGKWLELLKQIAPGVTRVAVLRDASQALCNEPVCRHAGGGAIAGGGGDSGQHARCQRDRAVRRDFRALSEWRSDPGGKRCGGASSRANPHAGGPGHKLPAIYWERFFVTAGGLMSYGADLVGQFRQAAGYVDRILKGEKPADLPVQAPTKYDLAINLKTAKALGLEIPPMLLARADEVIE